MILGVIVFVYLPTLTVQSGLSCCGHAEDVPGCQHVCQQLSGSPEQHQVLTEVVQQCPRNLLNFWQCINNTYAVFSSGEYWHGRTCCDLAFSVQCQNACQRARSQKDLSSQCRPSHEAAFINCIERQEVSAHCCGPATSSQCRAVCKAIFIEPSMPSRNQREAVAEHCDSHVANCVHNYTKGTPAHDPMNSMPCCDHTNNVQCQSRCREVLRTLTVEEEIINELITSCGNPDLVDPLWQCFLQKSGDVRPKHHSGGTIETAGIDGAKLMCCSKATTSRCRNLCVKTYSRGWTNSWSLFNTECGDHPLEGDLNLCLQEVEEPCQLGCEDLNYCTNFNHRPTELFRRCNAQADGAAEKDVNMWAEGKISQSLPLMGDIPLKNIAECEPEMWKAIACTLHIKPCHSKTHTSSICRSDCIHILSQCVKWHRLPEGQTAEAYCNLLAANSEEDCIPLNNYLSRSSLSRAIDVTRPCQPNPCGEDEVCVVNRRKCKHPDMCKPYICKQACPVGEVSSFQVARNTYVRIPLADSGRTCYKSCKCGHHNMLSHCQRAGCVRSDSCLMGSGRIQAHNSHFKLGCQECSCFSSELLCQERSCPSGSSRDRHHYTGLPCSCGSSYLPVCGTNGKTYPSACVARCLGLKDDQFQIGTCRMRNPCDPDPCRSGSTCVPKPQVCLNSRVHCPQYECVAASSGCNHHHHSPVCDTRGEEFTNLCLLRSHGRRVAHNGHCLSECMTSGEVCSHDGETYTSECAAWAEGATVDYPGRCRAIGQLTVHSDNPSCEGVQCADSSLASSCHMITPPGGCCPICGGEVRVLYSEKQAERVVRDLDVGPITVQNVTDVLASQLSTAECGVFGYISIEKDLVFLVQPLRHQPSYTQVRVCLSEAERLGSLIRLGSPSLMSHLAMSPVVTAHTRMSYIYASSSSSSPSSSACIWTCWLVLALTLIQAVCHR